MKFKKIILFLISIFIFNINVYADSTINVTKKLIGIDIPDVVFSFNVEPKDTNPEIINLEENYFNIPFNSESIINDRISEGTYTLDFSTINFTKPGRYEYIVREAGSTNMDVYPKDNNYYTIELNVLNEVDQDNNPTGNLIVDVYPSAYLNDSSGKGDIVFETTPLTYINLSKKVTGDIADTNEYFKFKITIDGDKDGYTIDGQDDIVTYNGQTLNTSRVYNSGIDNYIYLKHGQSVTIGLDGNNYQISSNLSYTIEEMDAQNYKTYINNSEEDNKTASLITVNRPESNTVSYINNNESTVLTGLFVSILPYALLISLSIIGIYVLKKKSKKTNNN